MPDRTEYINIAEKLCRSMAELDFQETYARFSEAMKSSLSEEALRDTWASVTGVLGNFSDIHSINCTQDGVILVIMRYELRGLSVCISFSGSGVVESLYVNYYNLPEKPVVTEQFAEKSIQIPMSDGDSLDGMLTCPAGGARCVVVMVQGSGQTDMNETIGSGLNTPFKDIAHGLAAHGVASIRYNKRFYQYPGKASSAVTVRDEVLDDVCAAITLAAGEFEHVYVLGHSLGAMLAPIIAQENPAVEGVISMAGSPRKLQDIIYGQYLRQLSRAGYPEDMLASALEELSSAVEMINGLSARDSGSFLGTEAAYWYSLNQLKPRTAAKSLTVPMLFLQGSADFQISVDDDFAVWEKILRDAPNAEFTLYDELNHLFMKTNGFDDERDYETKGNVSQQVIEDMAGWIAEHD